MDKTGGDSYGLRLDRLGEFENVSPPFIKFTVCQFIHVSKCHLHSCKIILSCYEAMILQMNDSGPAKLTFRVHN